MTDKPRIAIFKNKLVGQPIKRKDGTLVEYNGKQLTHCDLNGKITLPEGLEAGEYEVNIYQNTSKNGLVYYSGSIKPAYKKEIDQHSVDKSNGFQPQEEEEEVPF